MPKKSMDFMRKKENWSTWRISNHAHLKKHLSTLPDSAAVLDLAAGRSFYRDYFSRFTTFIATDFYPFDGIHIVADTNGTLPFQDGVFDAVCLSNVLEHMPDPEITMAECARILKKGGKVIIQTPFLMGLHDEPYDFFRYTKYAARHLLEKSGFTEIEVENLSSFMDVYQWFHREFFKVMLAHSHQSLVMRAYIRALRKLGKLSFSLLPPSLSAIQDEANAKGYGYIGIKR